MTAVEFFDRTPIENVVSSLTTVPDKIIFIGDNKLMKKHKTVYERFLAHRGLSTQLEYKSIKKNDLNDIVNVLSDIVEKEENCFFDLTGGEDLVLVAMGIVSQRYAHKSVQMQRFNVNNGVVTDCDGDGKLLYQGSPVLSVDEQILLHGGAIRYADELKECTYRWDISEEFVQDVRAMWEICRADPRDWNSRLNVLNAIEALSSNAQSLEVCVSIPELQTYMNLNGVAYVSVHELLCKLKEAHLIFGYERNKETIAYRYKDHQIRKCLNKAGTVLEMKVLVEAKAATHKNGERYYTDAVSGAFIDWDGEFHSGGDDQKDTENEIDLILMKGMIPIFISCKNGQVTDAELYKMDAVINHFGGMYAKRILIATYLSKKPETMEHFRLRAEAMGIHLIDGVDKLDQEQFVAMIKDLFNKN